MRITNFACGVGVAVTALSCAAVAAPVYRYCAHYEDRGDVTCAYDTFQQCLDTARGPAGGFCSENPAYRPSSAPPARGDRSGKNV